MQQRLMEALGRPVDPRPLAFTRIGIGIASGMIGLETWRILIKVSAPDKLQVPAFSWLPGLSHELIWALLGLWTLSAAALTIGLRARLAAGGLALLAVLAMLLDEQAYSNHLALMVVLCALLALGRPGAAWSLDAHRRGGPTAGIPYWSVFLIKLQISVLYGFAALSKVNDTYLSGDVLDRSTRLGELGDPALSVLSGSAIAVELFLSLALWNERLQKVAFPLGLGFHLLIVITFANPLPLVPFAMLALSPYVLFLRAKPGTRLVLWDQRCAFCDRWASLLRRLDLLGVHRFAGSGDSGTFSGAPVKRAEMAESIQLLAGDQRDEGYDAVRRVLEVSPATFLIAPVLELAPLVRLGRSAYDRAARRGPVARSSLARLEAPTLQVSGHRRADALRGAVRPGPHPHGPPLATRVSSTCQSRSAGWARSSSPTRRSAIRPIRRSCS